MKNHNIIMDRPTYLQWKEKARFRESLHVCRPHRWDKPASYVAGNTKLEGRFQKTPWFGKGIMHILLRIWHIRLRRHGHAMIREDESALK